MRPAGLAAVEAAQADGRWERAYAGSATITVPDDLAAALAAEPAARAGVRRAGRGQPVRRPLPGAHRATARRPARSGSPTLCRCWPRAGASTDRRDRGSDQPEADAEAEAALVDAGDRDRRPVGAGVHHHPVADVEAHVADRRVEEDQVAGLQLRTRAPGAERGLRAAGVRQRDAGRGVGVGREAGAVEGVRAGGGVLVPVADLGQGVLDGDARGAARGSAGSPRAAGAPARRRRW